MSEFDYVGSRLGVLPAEVLGDLEALKADCQAAFTAKDAASKGGYSQGSTFFVRASEAPSCLLEQLVKSIFDFHVRERGIADLAAMEPANSGVEWWTQCIDARDDIAWHWDRDYALEENAGVHKYPNLATVTYLTCEGGATAILNCKGSHGRAQSLPSEDIHSWCLSKPAVGKHLFFAGDLLHAAPSSITEGDDDGEDSDEGGEDEDGEDEDEEGPLRVTLLANIWINHVPQGAARFPAHDFSTLLPPSPATQLAWGASSRESSGDGVFRVDAQAPQVRFSFRDDSRRFLLQLRVPVAAVGDSTGDLVRISCQGSGTEARLEDLGLASSDDDDDEEDEEEEESEEEEGPTKKQRRERSKMI